MTRPPNVESRAGELDRVRILIERENIRAGAQDRFGMAAAAAGRIDDKGAGVRRKQLEHFCDEHRPVISRSPPFPAPPLDTQWTGREPDRPFKQQCVHHSRAR